MIAIIFPNLDASPILASSNFFIIKLYVSETIDRFLSSRENSNIFSGKDLNFWSYSSTNDLKAPNFDSKFTLTDFILINESINDCLNKIGSEAERPSKSKFFVSFLMFFSI